MTFALAMVTMLVAVLAFVLGALAALLVAVWYLDAVSADRWGKSDAEADRERATLEKASMQKHYDKAYDKHATRH